jgi:predicted Fe-Mo cluster-binding NifX family protein
MIIAIPVADGKLFSHFGHCANFALLTVDDAAKKVVSRQDVAAPPHEPGLLPRWLAERGVNLVIAGGMGGQAVNLCNQHGIDAIVGAPPETPEVLAAAYLGGRLSSGTNRCDH